VAPPVNIASIDRAARVDAIDEIKRALEIAEQIPFRFLVQHLGTSNESFSEKKFEAAMTSIEHLRAFAKPLGVRILLENIPNELSTPDRLVEMIGRALRRCRRLFRLRARSHGRLVIRG
jgi:sugar phosphate isomerase/epimerase